MSKPSSKTKLSLLLTEQLNLGVMSELAILIRELHDDLRDELRVTRDLLRNQTSSLRAEVVALREELRAARAIEELKVAHLDKRSGRQPDNSLAPLKDTCNKEWNYIEFDFDDASELEDEDFSDDSSPPAEVIAESLQIPLRKAVVDADEQKSLLQMLIREMSDGESG